MAGDLSDEDQQALAARGQEQDAPAGQVLIREGATAGSLFVILAGRVRVGRGGKPLGELGPGEVLGELAMLGQGARGASAIVEEDARLLVVPATAVRELLAERPTLREGLERAAAGRRSDDLA
ncbi:MAG: family transcriptional regulator, cyclic receptor protein [Gaiellales bacterium]|jgi:CRP-like cAMP-binding protein|nr:family transcriptional regulator, cyclic receptor protein [Gaiellales bacterium]